MKYFVLSILILFPLLGCAQNSKNMEKEVNELLGNLYKEVQYQNKAINYHADIFIGGCNFEVLINDFPVHSYYGDGRGAVSTSIPINTAILKPGKQTWKIKIYPVRKLWKEDNVPMMSIEESIAKGARAEISIQGIHYDNEGGIKKSFGKVVDFEAPLVVDSVSKRKVLSDAGKPYIEYSGVFEAKVPYQLKGWTDGQDLSKIDKDDLLEELVNKYQAIRAYILSTNLTAIAKEVRLSELETAQSLFYSKEDNEEFLNDFIEGWGTENILLAELKNYEIKYYGNNRIVTLVNKFSGISSLFGNYKVNGLSKSITFTLYFYLPEGESELKIIR